MIISVINHAQREIADSDLQRVIRAVNRQIEGDFAPHWSLSATLRLEGRTRRSADLEKPRDAHGEAVLYVWDRTDSEDALGYHDLHHRGIPCGFVFTTISKKLDEHWSVTFSHEVLELVGDPELNLLAMGPHPQERGRDVFHWREMCDAVQADTYEVDGVEVSNFVLPLYFTSTEELGARNDFLGRRHPGGPLRSFGVNPGGYVNFYDPLLQDDTTFEADARGAKRQRIKSAARGARRGIRYKRFRVTAESAAVKQAAARRG